ncbi:MAG TPA: hypothetical protein VFT37_15995 [Telluria sp.]|nr:hypothetical protein [Telluria sp.]
MILLSGGEQVAIGDAVRSFRRKLRRAVQFVPKPPAGSHGDCRIQGGRVRSQSGPNAQRGDCPYKGQDEVRFPWLEMAAQEFHCFPFIELTGCGRFMVGKHAQRNLRSRKPLSPGSIPAAVR